MSAAALHVIGWQTLGCALLVYGFAPGVVLRLIVLLYPPDHPRRRELLGELYRYPRIERPFWVAEQLETALFQGLGGRLAVRRAARMTLTRYLPSRETVNRAASVISTLRRAGIRPDEIRQTVFFPVPQSDFRRTTRIESGLALITRDDLWLSARVVLRLTRGGMTEDEIWDLLYRRSRWWRRAARRRGLR